MSARPPAAPAGRVRCRELQRACARRAGAGPTSVEAFGHTLSLGAELAIVVVFAAIFIALAIRGSRARNETAPGWKPPIARLNERTNPLGTYI